MKFKLLPLGLAFMLSISVIFQSCNSDTDGTDTTDDTTDNLEDQLVVDEDEPDDGFGETFYPVPSPEDLFVFLKHDNLEFHEDLLSPIENVDKYIDIRSKELNFGVYSADLAYSAAFSMFPQSLSKINSVRELSEELNLSAVFDQALRSRIDALFSGDAAEPDSLMAVANTSYYNMVAYLEDNDREKSLALISAGGWVESLYIVISSVDKYEQNSTTIQHIADQKLSFENLVMYLQKYSKDPNVQQTLDELYKIKEVYDNLDRVEMASVTTGATDDGKFVTGGKDRINITEAQFNNLKQKITEVRNNITQASVK